MDAVDIVTVLKSPTDAKEYRALILTNGMKVLLIHDPEIAEDKQIPFTTEDNHCDEDGEDLDSILSDSDLEDQSSASEHCSEGAGVVGIY